MKRLWRFIATWARWLLTHDCGHIGCGVVEPYGFVPEEGCPVHDRPGIPVQFTNAMARRSRNGVITLHGSLTKEDWQNIIDEWNRACDLTNWDNIAMCSDDGQC